MKIQFTFSRTKNNWHEFDGLNHPVFVHIKDMPVVQNTWSAEFPDGTVLAPVPPTPEEIAAELVKVEAAEKRAAERAAQLRAVAAEMAAKATAEPVVTLEPELVGAGRKGRK